MSHTKKHTSRRRLQLEHLQVRQLMAADIMAADTTSVEPQIAASNVGFGVIGPPSPVSINVGNGRTFEGALGETRQAWVTISRNGSFAEPQRVRVASYDDTAKAGDGDYVKFTRDYVIPAGRGHIVIPVTILGDNKYESNEKFKVVATALNSRGNPIWTSGHSTGEVSITNDDAKPTTTVVPLTKNMSVKEGDAGYQTLGFDFAPNNPSSKETVVRVRTQDGSTRGGVDYSAVDKILRWAPGQTHVQRVYVNVYGDMDIERNEQFRVVVEPIANTTVAPRNYVDVNIQNDDYEPPVIKMPDLVFDHFREAEGPKGERVALATLRLSEPVQHSIGINFESLTGGAWGNATLGEDFQPISGQVVFYPGQTRATVEIPIIGDNLIEHDEYFHIKLKGDLNRVNIPNPYLGVTLVNDDAPLPNANVATFANGTWWVDAAGDGSSAEYSVQFGLPGDTPLTGDYDGDGRLDLVAVRRNESTGMLDWYFDFSADGTLNRVLHYGLLGDVPVAGDFNGDGRHEATVVRENYWTGGLDWYMDFDQAGFAAEQVTRFGNIGDRVVPGDFDGNGRTDFTVARKEGQFLRWYIDTAGDGVFAERDAVFGLATDTPLVGDWDGDGDDDFAVARQTIDPRYVDIYFDLNDGADREEERRARYDWGTTDFLS